MGRITQRHDEILSLLTKAVTNTKIFDEVLTNRTVPLQQLLGQVTVSRETQDLKPDLIAICKELKTIVLADVTVPFDNGPQAFYQARQAKLNKYLPLTTIFQDAGWTAHSDAFVVGAPGTWDYKNHGILGHLGVRRPHQYQLARRTVAEAVVGSRLIYNSHVNGVAQQRTFRPKYL